MSTNQPVNCEDLTALVHECNNALMQNENVITLNDAETGYECREATCSQGASNACGYCDYHCPHGQPHRPIDIISNVAVRERVAGDWCPAPHYEAWLNGDTSYGLDSAADDLIRQHFGLGDESDTVEALLARDVLTEDEARWVADGDGLTLRVDASNGPEFLRAFDKLPEFSDQRFVTEYQEAQFEFVVALSELVTRAGASELVETLRQAGCPDVTVL